MDEISIRAEGLGKRFRIGIAQPYRTLREALMERVRVPRWGATRAPLKGGTAIDELWAIRNVDFEIARGEVVGIIGRNGAGKSTLLKILSRITEPSEGRAELHGRVGSLLEVGTGFHPELTGRENIQLNGAILGMRRAEIRTRFDAIVAFSGVERFLDTPVKRYSTGMRVRLAFAVAAHLEPEILLVDEVLAVGDAEFQRKCLGKMSDIARGGRTVIFVSHNMNAVQQLCTRGLVLEEGRVSHQGPIEGAIDRYFSGFSRQDYGDADLRAHPGRPPTMESIARSIRLIDGSGECREVIKTGDDLLVEIEYDCGDATIDIVHITVNAANGERLLTVGSHHQPELDLKLVGRGVIRCEIPNLMLSEGEYNLAVAFSTALPRRNIDYVEAALSFRVHFCDFFGTGAELAPGQGRFAQRSRWEAESRP